MNVKERKLALVLLGVLSLGAAVFLVYQLYLSPLAAHNEAIADLNDKLDKRDFEVHEILKTDKQVQQWRALSLPKDVNFSWLEYEKFLTGLVKKNEFNQESVVIPKPPDTKGPALKNKQPIYTRLEYQLTGRATLAHLVNFLHDFYRTPLLHRVKKITIQRPGTPGPNDVPDELRVDLTVEALVLEGAKDRKTLLPSASVQKEVLAPLRSYDVIASKNIFLGPPRVAPLPQSVDVTQFVKLTDISYVNGRWQAFLYDVYNNRSQRLRADRGFDQIRIRGDQEDYLVEGKVERIDDVRELIFSENGKYFRMHVGQTLAQALGRNRSNALKADEVKELGLGQVKKTEATKKTEADGVKLKTPSR